MLKDFRTQVEQIKTSEVTRSLNKLNNNEPVDKVFTEFANRLAQKFMHSPSKLIRQAGESNQQQVLEILADAFELNLQDKN